MQIQIQEVSHHGDLCGSGSNKKCIPVFVSVADSEPFDADPDPTFPNDADPDAGSGSYSFPSSSFTSF